MTLLNLIPFIPGVLIAALALVHGQMQPAHAQTPIQPTSASTRNDPNFYVGMWVTADGFIRHECCVAAATTKRAAPTRAPTVATTA